MFMNSKKLCTRDEDGNLRFEKRRQLHKAKHRPDSVWNSTWFLMVIILACIAADYASFSSLFASFLYDNAFLRNICIVALILIFEVSPVYLGYNMKRRSCGYTVSKISIIVPLVAFVLGAVANVALRLATHSLVFPDLTNTTTSVIGGGAMESGSSQNSIVYAWFFGLLPIITSLVAFAATYTISNPLKREFEKLKRENIEITDQIDQLEAILAEYSSDDNYLERILADDEAKYNAALSMLRSQRDEHFDYVRQRISEHLGSPSATGYLVEHSVPN